MMEITVLVKKEYVIFRIDLILNRDITLIHVLLVLERYVK